MNETEMLSTELEHYRREKERVRKIIGQIGGKTSRQRDVALNISFLVLVVGLFCLDLLREVFHVNVPALPPALTLEVAVLLVSLKVVWMIHQQTKVDHFQFWVLNSIEFQINIISKRLRDLEARLVDERAQSPSS